TRKERDARCAEAQRAPRSLALARKSIWSHDREAVAPVSLASSVGRQSTNLAGSAKGRPKASATAAYVTFPSATLRPFKSAGLSRRAFFHPLFASCIAYGSVAFVRASVDVRG